MTAASADMAVVRDHFAAVGDSLPPGLVDAVRDRIVSATERGCLASALGLKQQGPRFFCPACQSDGKPHRTPDLSVDAGFKCHRCGWSGDAFGLVQLVRGCDFKASVHFLADAFHVSAGSARVAAVARPRTDDVSKRKGSTWLTVEAAADAVCAVLSKGGEAFKVSGLSRYGAAAAVARFDSDLSKSYRPFHLDGDAWRCGDPPGLWPLYRGDGLPAAGLVLVVEGEKCADAVAGLGLGVVTSAHGANAAGKSDWAALAGRDVVVLPDNDKAGRDYAADVARLCSGLNPPARVRVCEPFAGADGYDVADWVADRDTAGLEALAAELRGLAEAAPLWTPPAGDAPPSETAAVAVVGTPTLGTRTNPLELAKAGLPLARTDTGFAERFAFYFGGEVAYQIPSGYWLVWDGTHWAPDAGLVSVRRRAAETARRIKEECFLLPSSMGEARAAYCRFAFSCEALGRIEAAMKMAPSLGLARPLAGFDADRMLLNVANGTVDLRTGTLRPHRREDFITHISPVAFDSDAADPLFRRFIDHVTGGDAELEGYLQRAAGYTLTGTVGEKCLFIVYSEATDTGKTCFLVALQTILGDYSLTISFDVLLEPDRGGGPNYDLAKLCGSRLAVASETKPGRRFAAELVKNLTGGDLIRAREIRQSSIEFLPSHKLWLCTNHAPMLSDGGDAATWNRLRRIPFNCQVPRAERDPRIKAALEDPNSATARAFLAWAVRGAVAWQNCGLGSCRAVDDSVREYQTETDPLADFVEDRCTLDPFASCKAADLRAEYESWAKENGQRFTLSRKAFAAALRRHACAEKKGTGGVRLWEGIGLRVA
jgi:putative DNA primase/helicase